MLELQIVTDPVVGKGRSFRASLLAHAASKTLLEGGDVRPLWAMVACSDAESLPFIRNLQSGRKATLTDSADRNVKQTFDCLKSLGYEYHAQRHPEGSVHTLFLSSLYRRNSGMVDPDGVRFAMIPRTVDLAPVDGGVAEWLMGKYRKTAEVSYDSAWARKMQAESDAKRLEVCRYATQIGPLFCDMLDLRTRCPLIPDARFYALVTAAMLDAGYATLGRKERHGEPPWGHGGFHYEEHGTADVGLSPGLACNVSHAALEALMAQCVKAYEGGTVTRMAA